MTMILPAASGRVPVCASLLPLLCSALSAAALAQDAGLLQGSAIALPPLSVTANRVDTPLAEIGSSLSIITREQLEARQTRIVSDVLREVPGLAVNRTGTLGNLTQIRIRGAEGNQTLVLIDGIEVNDPAAGSELDFAHLLAADIERIEVLRGPQSALYGSDAIGGVINIITRRGQGRPTLRASLEGGSFNTYQGNGSVSGGGERYDFLVSGAGIRTSGVSTAAEWRGNSESDGYRNGTAFAKLGFRPLDNLEFDLIGRYTAFKGEGDDFLGGIGATDARSDQKGTQTFGRAQGRLTLLDGRWQHILGVAYTDHDRDNLTDDVVNSSFRGKKTRYDYQTNLFFDTPDLARARHTLTFLAEHERETVVSTSAFSDLNRAIESNGYVGQYRIGLLERLFLTGSVRFDKNDLFDDATTWRVSGAYLIEPTGTKLRAAWGTGVKNPTLFELFGFSQNFEGNPNLQPEEGRGWDVGIDQALWGGRASLSLTYFDQRIDQLIAGSGRTAVNLDGTSRARGVEIALAVTPVEKLTIQGSYTYTDTRDPNGQKLVRRPAHMASVNANYRFLEARANVNLGVIYNGRQDDFAFDAFFNRSIVALGGYTLVSLAGSFRLTDTLEVFGRVENALDQDYEEVFTYGTPGRAAYAGLRATF